MITAVLGGAALAAATTKGIVDSENAKDASEQAAKEQAAQQARLEKEMKDKQATEALDASNMQTTSQIAARQRARVAQGLGRAGTILTGYSNDGFAPSQPSGKQLLGA